MKTVHLPDDLYQRALALAEHDRVSVDKLVAALVHAHATEWEHLQDRANRGSVHKLKSVLDKVSDAEPEAFDRLP